MATINNHEFDLQYETYKHIANGLNTVYFRLCFNFPNDPSFKFWKMRKDVWSEYYKTTVNKGYKAFKTLEKLEAEISHINPEWILAEDLEKALILPPAKKGDKKVTKKVVTK